MDVPPVLSTLLSAVACSPSVELYRVCGGTQDGTTPGSSAASRAVSGGVADEVQSAPIEPISQNHRSWNCLPTLP